jgi:hypothetical protein
LAHAKATAIVTLGAGADNSKATNTTEGNKQSKRGSQQANHTHKRKRDNDNAGRAMPHAAPFKRHNQQPAVMSTNQMPRGMVFCPMVCWGWVPL